MNRWLRYISGLLSKYKYVLLVIVVGLLLMLLPSGKNDQEIEPANVFEETKEENMSEQLAHILSSIEGAGEVRVLLTVAAGEETVYQVDDSRSSSGDSQTNKVDTVTVSDGSRNQLGLVRQIIPASYQGAIIVCKGADDPRIKLAIVDAVSKATGLGADRISIMKMK